MIPDETFDFEAELWLWETTKAPWHFVTIPSDVSATIRFMAGTTNGFGSVPVAVTIGTSTWKTSVFPDKKSGCYLLPIKADIRQKQNIGTGDTVRMQVRIRA